MQSIWVVILLLFSMTAANAADIDVKQLDNKSVLILVEGDFELDDVERFRSKVATLSTSRVTVAFRSDGGSLVAGIRIGTVIREKKFATVIPDAASCASACALAWLGGAKRFMGQGASVGFHAAYALNPTGRSKAAPATRSSAPTSISLACRKKPSSTLPRPRRHPSNG